MGRVPLRSGDRVLGVSYNGIAKAYPIAIMDYHVVVNDSFGASWNDPVNWSTGIVPTSGSALVPDGAGHGGEAALPVEPEQAQAETEQAFLVVAVVVLTACPRAIAVVPELGVADGEAVGDQAEPLLGATAVQGRVEGAAERAVGRAHVRGRLVALVDEGKAEACAGVLVLDGVAVVRDAGTGPQRQAVAALQPVL